MGLLRYVPRQEVYINGVRRTLLDWNSSAGFQSFVATATVTLNQAEGPVTPGDLVAIRAGYGARLATCFVGEVDDGGIEYFPNTLTLRCSGQLARTQKGTGKVDPNAQLPPDQPGGQATDFAAAYSNMTDGQIVSALLQLCNIVSANIGDSGQTFGVLEPVRLGKDEPPWRLIQELDEATGYKTFDGLDGVVHRLPIVDIPSSTAGVALSQGVDIVKAEHRSTRRQIYNVVTVTGLPNITGTTGIPYTPTATRRGVSPFLKSDQIYTWNSTLLESASACDAVAGRKLGELNRLKEEFPVELGRLRNDIKPAMSATLGSTALSTSPDDRFWVEQVQHRSQNGQLSTALSLLKASAFAGFNPNQPPIALVTYQAEQETLADGSTLTLVTLDGSNSYDPDGTIVSYVWTGNPVAPTATGTSGTTASVLYTPSLPASATVTLTVTDDQGQTGATTITIAASGTNVMVRDIWAAVTTDLLYSNDGQKTWQGTGLAAVGCCQEAAPAYQLGWTAPGDLSKVSTATVAPSAVLTGQQVTAAWISYDQNGTFTKRCYAGCKTGAVWRSVDDGVTWTLMGTIPASGGSGTSGVTQIQESPYMSGELYATCGNTLWHSFSAGATWDVTYSHPTSGLDASRMAQGFGQGWVGFRGTGTSGEASRVEERANAVKLDVPGSAKPINVTGLTMDATEQRLYLTDIDGTGTSGRAWVAPSDADGTFTSAAYPTATFGLPRHIVRDGAFRGLVYGAADKVLFKSPNEFQTLLTMKNLVTSAGQSGQMIGFGALRAPSGVGNFIASVWDGDTTLANSALVKLGPKGWEYLAACPTPEWDQTNWGGLSDLQRPLLRVAANTYLSWVLKMEPSLTLGTFDVASNVARSTDGGKTWTTLGAPCQGVMAIVAAADGVCYAVAASGRKIVRSADAGATWTVVATNAASEANLGQQRWVSLAVNAANSQQVQVNRPSIDPDGRIRISRDGGATWTGYNVGAEYAGTWQSSIAGDRLDSATLLYGWTPDNNKAVLAAVAIATGVATQLYDFGSGPAGYKYFPTLRRAGGVQYFLSYGATPVYRSTTDGASWASYYSTATQNPAGRAVPGANDVVYDPLGDTVYLGHQDIRNADTSKPPACFVALRSGSDPNGTWEDLTPSEYAKLGRYWRAYRGGMQPL